MVEVKVVVEGGEGREERGSGSDESEMKEGDNKKKRKTKEKISYPFDDHVQNIYASQRRGRWNGRVTSLN